MSYRNRPKLRVEAKTRGFCTACFIRPALAPYVKCAHCLAICRKYANSPRGKRTERNTKLIQAYGINLQRKEEMFKEQDGLCALCYEPLDSITSAHVDHDHIALTVRGLLHNKCNILAGWLEKHASKIAQGQSYLAQWHNREKGPLYGRG